MSTMVKMKGLTTAYEMADLMEPSKWKALTTAYEMDDLMEPSKWKASTTAYEMAVSLSTV